MKHFIALLLLSSSLFAITDQEWQQKASVLIQSARDDARTTVVPTPTPVPVATNLWSDPKTWPDGKVPESGSRVKISSGKEVVLDSNLDLTALVIEGKLTVPHTATISAGTIMAQHGGEFVIDTQESVTITITNAAPEGVPGMGRKVLGAMAGGHLRFNGKQNKITWTQLDATVAAGEKALVLTNAVDWQVGDRIIVTSTSYNFEEVEERGIAEVNSNTIKVDEPLAFSHFGEVVKGVPKRAEVGLLSHNIVVQGAYDETPGKGGHVMVMDEESSVQCYGVEIGPNMGRAGELGRYSFHEHKLKRGGRNSFIRNCSIRNANNRGLVIHRTDGSVIDNVVIYGTYGHGVMEEDGRETENTINHCLVCSVYPSRLSPVGVNLDSFPDSENEQGDPSCFWLSNSNNTVTSNAAAGCYEHGNEFFIELRPTPHQGSITYAEDPSYNPSAQPMGIFRDNIGHSIPGVGENVADHGYACWIGAGSPGTYFRVDGFTSYACGVGGVWTGGIEPYCLLDRLVLEVGTHGCLNRTNTVISNSLFVKDPTFPYTFGVTQSAVHVYEGHGGTVIRDSTFIDFNTDAMPPAVILSSNPKINIGTDILQRCKSINSEIGLWHHEPEIEYAVHDEDDTFGNGGPGCFISGDWLVDASAKRDAKGIPVEWKVRNQAYGDGKLRELWWSPNEFIQAAFSTAAPTEGVKITRSDGKQLSTMSLPHFMVVGQEYEVTDMDGGPLHGGTVTVTAAKVGDALNYNVHWAAETVQARAITDMSKYPIEDIVQPAVSMEEFKTAKGAAVFLDSNILRIHLPVEVGSAASIRFNP